MPQVKLTERAHQDIDRLYKFLAEHDEDAAARAVVAILDAFKTLEVFPEAWASHDEAPEFRKLIIEFGNSGYSALYSFDKDIEQVLILAVKHQRENAYGLDGL